MDESLVFELLPARGLDQSMLLPVLVGLLVVLFFTEVFGWVFAGAVVPGYLASVLVIQPVTGVIVIFESLLTLAVAVGMAKVLSKSDAWTRFFGRDRFFLILIVSLVVRMHNHAWFAPWAIRIFDHTFGLELELQQEFYSVGLVLVPLTANMLWKPALRRGLTQLTVEVGITYLIVLYVLLPYTNLSLSSVELTYEDAAIDFVAHAKAHIILLSAALLAARLNLSFGWDFNGILVPALLAMLWLTPLKLVATLVEAVVVLYLTRGFLSLPKIRHMDFEGPRKIVVVFALAFLWKVALGFALTMGLAWVPGVPEIKVSDTYGFGYLLSSLLAVKMLSKGSVRAVMLPALTASAGGFVIGSVIGFVFELFVPPVASPPQVAVVESTRLDQTPLGSMAVARMESREWGDDPEAPTQAELSRLSRFWAATERWVTADGARPGWLASTLAGVVQRSPIDAEVGALSWGVGLDVGEPRPVRVGPMPAPGGEDLREARSWYLVKEEQAGHRGWPTAMLAPGAEGPVLVVPMPGTEAPAAEAAVVLCRRLDCRAILVAGREQVAVGTKIHPRPLEQAMAAFGDHPMIVLRGDLEPELSAEQAALQVADLVPWLESGAARSGESPPPQVEAEIRPLRGSFDIDTPWPSYALDWEPRETSVRLPSGEAKFVLLRTTGVALEAMVVAGLDEFAPVRRGAPEDPGSTPGPMLGASELVAELARMQEDREPPGMSGAGYRAPSAAELRVLENLVVGPLVGWVSKPDVSGEPPVEIRAWAALLDYEIVQLGGCAVNSRQSETRRIGLEPPRLEPCLTVLRDVHTTITAGWGTLVLRSGEGFSALVEVPRPHRERETWRIGAELWQVSDARALLIAGADGRPDETTAAVATEQRLRELARGRGSVAQGPNPVAVGNLGTPFQAMHQAMHRATNTADAGPVIQIRGIAAHRELSDEVIVGHGHPVLTDPGLEGCASSFDPPLDAVMHAWGGCRVAGGSADLYLLTGAGVPQLEYTRELSEQRELRVLWLSARIRERFSTDRNTGVLRGLGQVGFGPTGGLAEVDEVDRLLAPLRASAPLDPEAAVLVEAAEVGEEGFERAVALAVAYAETDNLHQLRELYSLELGAPDLRIDVGVGRSWGQPFLVVELVGDRIGRRAMVLLEHELEGTTHMSWAEIADAPRARLEAEALARVQTLVILGIPVAAAVDDLSAPAKDVPAPAEEARP